MPDILAWLIALWALSLVGFPIASSVTGLGRLADRGWAVSRALAMLLLAWITWVGGTLGVIPNSQVGMGVTLLLMAAVSGSLAWRRRAELGDFFRRRWTVVATTEALFLALFAFWALVISEVPAINHTEKPMDFGIFNAIANAPEFPPEDPWLSGHSIAYYYGGHHIAAMLKTLTGVSSPVAYNLAVATLPAMFGAGILGLIYGLLRLGGSRVTPALAVGVGTALAVALLSNLSGALEFAYVRGLGGEGVWQWIGIKGLEPPSGGSGWLPDGFWWWWRGTRVIDTLAESGASLDYTITEFPLFSFLLGDLHAHVSALPFLTLALSLALSIVIASDPPDMNWLTQRPWEFGALALTLGGLAFINAWDFPVYLCIVGMAAALRWISWRSRPPPPALHGPPTPAEPKRRHSVAALARPAGQAILGTMGLAVAGVILYLPFYLSFDSQTSGILPYTGPASRPFLFFVVIGAPAILAAGFVGRAAIDAGWPAGDRRGVGIILAGIAAGVFALWLIGVAVRVSLSSDGVSLADGLVVGRLMLALPLLLLGAASAYCAVVLSSGAGRTQWLVFALALAAVGFFLLGGAELFHISDQFGNRMNTVFKFYYQAWLLLGIAGAVGMYYMLAIRIRQAWITEWPLLVATLRLAWVAVISILLIASAYYPVGAILERTGWTAAGEGWNDNTLSGLEFLRRSDPGEYEAIMWLAESAGPGRILEAVGDPYSGYGGISAAAGRATPLSWEGHERQWRGDDINPELARRRADVETMYTSDNGVEVRGLLRHYGIRWLVAGPRESSAHGRDVGDRMVKWVDEGWLTPAFESSGVAIYEVAGSGGDN